MDSLLFAVNAVAPLIFMVAIGYFLKRIGLIDADFAKKGNRAVFRVFLPVMLFLNVYKIDSSMDIGAAYIIYAVIASLVIFGLSLVIVPLVTKEKERYAPLMQATFRSNYALIGIPLAEALYGSTGVAVAALLSAFSIPLFNILAVLLFSIHGTGEKPTVKSILIGIIKNPLIIGVALGGVFLLLKNLLLGVGVTTTLLDIVPISKTLNYLSGLATPLALLMLGAQFEFSAVPGLKKEIIFGTVVRTVIAPIITIGVALLMGVFNGAHLACFVALFATPVAVSTVPMAQELGGDTKLAGQLVVWTTLISTFTIFFFSFALKAMGYLG